MRISQLRMAWAFRAWQHAAAERAAVRQAVQVAQRCGRACVGQAVWASFPPPAADFHPLACIVVCAAAWTKQPLLPLQAH